MATEVKEVILKTTKELYTIKKLQILIFFRSTICWKIPKGYVLRKKWRYKFTHNTTKLILDTEEKATSEWAKNFGLEKAKEKYALFVYLGTKNL